MKHQRAIVGIVVVAGLFYALTLRGIPGNPTPSDFKQKLDQQSQPFELSPERGRYVHLVALATYGRYDLTQELAEAAFPDVGVYDGRFYSYFAPGLPYLVLPMYLLGERFDVAQVGSFAFIAMVSIVALIFLFRIAREIFHLPLWAGLAVVSIFAFGTTAWSYAITLYQHHVTTFFMLSSFYAVWRFRQGGRGSFWWAAFATADYALALTIDYPNAVLLLPNMAYLLYSAISLRVVSQRVVIRFRSECIFAALVFLVITGAHLYHNHRHFGAWNHLSGGLQSYRYVDTTLDPTSAGLTAPADLNAQKNIVGFFREEQLPFSFTTLFFSRDRGLFLYAPIFLFAFVGLTWLYRRQRTLELIVLSALLIVHAFLYSSWGDPWGGWAYGPRYLIPSMAWLSLMVGVAISLVPGHRFFRRAAFPLFLYSSGVALVGALTTNAVPPKIEADFLHMKYNFFMTWDVLQAGRSSSYLYRTFFTDQLTLPVYAGLIYIGLAIVMAIILFILPRKKDHA